jgi:type IV secretory pathway VirB9-like protein
MARATHHRNERGLAAHLRPTAKRLMKEALRVYGAAEAALTQAGEQFEGLVSEARAELHKAPPSRRDKRHQDTSSSSSRRPVPGRGSRPEHER